MSYFSSACGDKWPTIPRRPTRVALLSANCRPMCAGAHTNSCDARKRTLGCRPPFAICPPPIGSSGTRLPFRTKASKARFQASMPTLSGWVRLWASRRLSPCSPACTKARSIVCSTFAACVSAMIGVNRWRNLYCHLAVLTAAWDQQLARRRLATTRSQQHH
jgi:hypothetical protein